MQENIVRSKPVSIPGRAGFRAFLLGMAAVLSLAKPAHAVSTTVVISEVMAGDAQSPSDKFLELRNLTAQDIDISGYVVASRSSTGTTNNTVYTAPLGTWIPANGFFLLVSSTYASNNPDQAYNALLPSSSYPAITSGGLALFPGTPPADGVTGRIDALGYGPATNVFYEGTRAPQLNRPVDGSTSLERLPTGEGIQDTDNNAADYQLTNFPTPTSTPPNVIPPSITSAAGNPARTNPDTDVTLTAVVQPGTNPVASVTADLSPFGLSATTQLTNTSGTTWSVTFHVAAGTAAGNRTINLIARDSIGRIGLGSTTLFVKPTAAILTVAQARAHPFNSEIVRVRGICTAISTGLAYIEDANADAAIAVDDGTTTDGTVPLQVGQDVTVTGTIGQVNIYETEVRTATSTPDDIAMNSSGNTLPVIKSVAAPGLNSLDQTYEGQLVTIKHLTVTAAPSGINVASGSGGIPFQVVDLHGTAMSVYVHFDQTQYASLPYPGPPANPIPASENTSGTLTRVVFPTIQVGQVYNVTGPLGRRSQSVEGITWCIRPRDNTELVLVPANVAGDIDQSGTVDVSDGALALKVAAGLVSATDATVSLANGDVYPAGAPDGAITIGDAVRILRSVQGLDTL